MILASNYVDADRNQRVVAVHGDHYVLRGYVGNSPVRGTYVDGNEVNDNDQPQGFLVHQPPHSITPPHFHETNQFQVFVGGSGRLGKKAAAPFTVQFAGGHTPYGPICAGPDGVEYFTLRQRWDPGAKYMPKMRDRLQRGRQRQMMAVIGPRTPTTELRGWGAPVTTVLFEGEADGLCAARTIAGPGEVLSPPPPSEGAGSYLLILGGGARLDGQELTTMACGFASAQAGPVTLKATSGGVDLLSLRFPTPEQTET